MGCAFVGNFHQETTRSMHSEVFLAACCTVSDGQLVCYFRSSGNYFSAYTVTDEMVYYNYFFLPVITTGGWEINAKTVKFIPALASTLKLKINFLDHGIYLR